MGYVVLLIFSFPLQIIIVNGTAKQLLLQKEKKARKEQYQTSLEGYNRVKFSALEFVKSVFVLTRVIFFLDIIILTGTSWLCSWKSEQFLEL